NAVVAPENYFSLLLLTSEDRKRGWLLVHDPDPGRRSPFDRDKKKTGTALCYASLLGLVKAAQRLLSAEVDVNAQGGWYGSTLQVALNRGHQQIVEILLANGADFNAQGGKYGSALHAASNRGHEKIVQVLLANSAEVNAQRGWYGTALLAASDIGYQQIVEMLVAKGAESVKV
ncbi:hypothetical protein LTR17_027767, partial [Elasticomyces elasticus]